MKKIILIIIITIFAININSLTCLAYDFDENSGIKNTAEVTGHNKSEIFKKDNLPEAIGMVIKISLGLLGVAFLFLIIYGGYTWMLAKGNQQEVDKAIKTIQNALIGLIVVLMAYVITTFIAISLRQTVDYEKFDFDDISYLFNSEQLF